METLILAIALVLGLLAVFAVGAPAVSRLAEATLLRRRFVDTYDPGRRPSLPEASRPRKPLDLGPDVLSWPSERRADKPWVDTLRWPSERWDDPYFGARARARARSAVAAEAAGAARPRPPEPAAGAGEGRPPRRASPPPRRASPPPRRDAPAPTGLELGEIVGHAWTPEAPSPPSDPRAAPPPSAPAPPAASSPASRLPPPDEVRALIRSKGLANALREVAARSGLSLSEVADEVLRHRKG